MCQKGDFHLIDDARSDTEYLSKQLIDEPENSPKDPQEEVKVNRFMSHREHPLSEGYPAAI